MLAWPEGLQLSPDLMSGEGSSCMESSLPGLTDGQPQEKDTWRGHVVIKCSSLDFICKMLLGWQDHTCPSQEQPTEAPVALGRLWWKGWSGGLSFGVGTCPRPQRLSLCGQPQRKPGGHVGTLNYCQGTPHSTLPRQSGPKDSQDLGKARSLHCQPTAP